MTPRKTRRLTDAEIELWLKVAESVTPRSGARLPEARAVTSKPAAAPVVDAAPSPGPSGHRPSLMPSYTPTVSQPKRTANPPLVPMEKRYRQKVARGGVEIERVMDLHGLTQAEAHDALRGFLRSSQLGGARLVLVVTGKGRARVSLSAAIDSESGVLRRAVPNWLRSPDLRSVVLGFEEASLSHGGLGALYVRLRKLER